MRQATREQLHTYWEDPEPANSPVGYSLATPRSQFLSMVMGTHVPREANILEVGCNVGRNLDYLLGCGYRRLSGIDISELALQALPTFYPRLAEVVTLYNAPVEDVIHKFQDGEFDVVFTMAVLEHLHPDSEWVFAEVLRVSSSFIITIEEERRKSWCVFPRNYQRIFEALGARQIWHGRCREAQGLEAATARVFRSQRLLPVGPQSHNFRSPGWPRRPSW